MEKKHTLRTVLITALITTLLLSFVFVNILFFSWIRSENFKTQAILHMMEEKYYAEVDTEEAKKLSEEYAAAGLVYSLNDPYSEYITAEDFSSLQESLSGTYYGVGVTISYLQSTGYVTVVANPFHGSPAQKAGLRYGDCLLSVDDLPITQETMDQAVSYMRTPKEDGTPLLLTWLRDGKEMSAEIIPTDVIMNSVNYKEYGNIAYIQLTGFDEQTPNAFLEYLEGAKEKNMKGLVLDLRDNPGGIMEVAVTVCDALLPKGTVVYTMDKEGKKETYTSDREWIDIPMVVLVNGGSASASEIVAGALKDYDRATIIGEKTYGKGVVQGIYPLYDGSAVKLTISRYFTPGGVCIDGTGIEPDETVLLPENTPIFNPMDFDLSVDTQMKRAIELLNQ